MMPSSTEMWAIDWLRGRMRKLTLGWPGARTNGPRGERAALRACSAGRRAGRCWVSTSPPRAPWMMTATTRAAMSAPMTSP